MSRKEDWARGEEWDAFVQHVREETLREMVDSSFVLSIAPGEHFDVKYAVELGMGIMLGKPMLLVVQSGREAPERLLRVADRVVYADLDTGEGRLTVMRAVEEFQKEFP